MGYNPFYFFGQAFRNIWRNPGVSIASVLVLIACLLVTGSFYAIDRNINYNLEELGNLNKILVYINETCPDDEIRRIKEDAEKCPGVKQVDLITKEQALEDEKERLGEEFSSVFEWLKEGENPYRASLEVEYLPGSDVKVLEERLAMIEGTDTVVSRSDMAQKVEQIKRVVSRVFVGMMILLFVVSVFIIITSIRLALSSRRKEITVMRYVGATGFFIIVPFLLEGAILGSVAAFAAFGIEIYVYNVLASGFSKEFFDLITLLPASSFSAVLFWGFWLIGLVTGLLGSVISLAKYLRK